MTEPVKLPFMPLYIADYLRDTSHLRAAESGAYLHLIMAYWVKGSLPNDDRQLATIAKMTAGEWRRARPILEKLFKPNFGGHKRVEKELAHAIKTAKENSEKARGAAKKRWEKHGTSNAPSMPDALPEQPPSNAPECTRHTSHVTLGGGGDDATDIAIEISRIAGFANPPHDWTTKWHGTPSRVQLLLNQGYDQQTILTAVRGVMAGKRDGPPDSFRYFEKAIARARAEAAAPLPTVNVLPAQEITVHAAQQRPDHIGEGLDRLRARLRAEDDATGDQGARPEPHRGNVEILPPRKAK